MKILKPFCILLLLLSTFYSNAQTKSEAIVGVWTTSGKEPARIEIYKSDKKFFGKIVWQKIPEDENGFKKDKNNPNVALRNQKIIGLIILKNFLYESANKWTDGEVYDPKNGKTYSCNIKLKDKNTLEVRGYIGISLIGRTEVWTRYQ